MKSGVNALFLMRDERYKMSLLDLAGRAVSEGVEMVSLGDTLQAVNISRELEWRMDALFGKGNWHLTIPFPEKKEFLTQLVIVADVSGSLCDDLNDLKRLPFIIEDLNKKGRSVFATLYMLGLSDCSHPLINLPDIVCSDFDTEHFRCGIIPCPPIKPTIDWQTEEDWGNGIACASRLGPAGGWSEGAARLGIVISDELPGGSECGKNDACASCNVGSATYQYRSLDNGIESATENKVKIFGLRADPCGSVTAPGTRGAFICYCKDVVGNYMNEITSKTGGKWFELEDASEVTKIIEKIIIETKKPEARIIDIGSPIPKRVRTYAYELLVPTNRNFTKATAYTWSA